MSPPDTVVTEPSIAVPLGHAGVLVERRRALGVRAWLLTALLFLVPMVTYWPATFHDFGLRDDYSNLREAHEEPGTVVKFCASHARPIYGWLLQATYGQTGTVQDLQWMRLGALLVVRRALAGELSRSASARLVVQQQHVCRRAARVDSVRAGDCRMGHRLAVRGGRALGLRRIFHSGRCVDRWV
jgi:hypothetical protein